jgi:hypothetical protein
MAGLDDNTVIVNGIKISGELIPMLINCLTNPDPHRWYRFERKGDNIIVHLRQDDTVFFS